jgi:DMSO/TMAO reductase YedYZ heme-binding membrane subunit
MAQSAAKQSFIVTHKKLIRPIVLLLAVGALVAPPLIVFYSHAEMQDTWTAIMRIAGFEALTLIFMNLVTGPLSKWFYKLFNPRRVRLFHIATGATGFALAVLHGTIVFVMAHYRDHNATWIIGPIALGLLIVTISVAVSRKRLPQVWRRIHQLNYLIFTAVFIKAMLIGTNVTSSTLAGNAAKAILSLEMLIVVLATAARIRTSTRKPSELPIEAEAE